MKRRTLILLLGGASSGAMSVGTGAFSNVSAEREVSVNVVEDEKAYLGLEGEIKEGVVRIKNQFAGKLELTVTAELESATGAVGVEADDGDIEVEIEGESDEGSEDGEASDGDNRADVTIGTGNSVDVTAECDSGGTLGLTFTFSGEVVNTGTTVDKTRTFTVGCDEDDDSNRSEENVKDHVKRVKFAGGGKKVRILTTENGGGGNGIGGVVDAKLYCGDEGKNVSENFEEVQVNTDVWIDDFHDDDLEKPIAKVEIDGGGTFENPDPGSGNIVDNTEDDSA
ncbi:hypothetical protein DJ79_04050 [Halorubrum ezzemoulense]|uniref:Uncharacterized protein n=1 Tax=Halorubrum ezzemoulense TaxID=337243 RepID=A0A256JJW8_HALEZ|nr:hypothetical protein [Halorubrum ezzemoulense]OYR69148.1 hypothetical protein DJ79_04050 [Halorubrum ezzemoulense]